MIDSFRDLERNSSEHAGVCPRDNTDIGPLTRTILQVFDKDNIASEKKSYWSVTLDLGLISFHLLDMPLKQHVVVTHNKQ